MIDREASAIAGDMIAEAFLKTFLNTFWSIARRYGVFQRAHDKTVLLLLKISL